MRQIYIGLFMSLILLANAYAQSRALRLADGPDEVHRNQIGRLELEKYD